MRLVPLFVLCFLLLSNPALAYVGPGLGAGAIGAVLGVLGAILLGAFAMIYYPIKRARRRRREARASTEAKQSQPAEPAHDKAAGMKG